MSCDVCGQREKMNKPNSLYTCTQCGDQTRLCWHCLETAQEINYCNDCCDFYCTNCWVKRGNEQGEVMCVECQEEIAAVDRCYFCYIDDLPLKRKK